MLDSLSVAFMTTDESLNIKSQEKTSREARIKTKKAFKIQKDLVFTQSTE